MMKKHDGKIDFDVLAEMDELHFAIKEALRMHPPLIMLLRMCHKPFKVTTTKGKDYVVPKGHIVATSPAFAHRMNDVFKDADVYNPNRFKAPTAEDKKAFASFIGFGGGRHGCMGETFAYMQIKTIWSVLLRNFDFELVGDVPERFLADATYWWRDSITQNYFYCQCCGLGQRLSYSSQIAHAVLQIPSYMIVHFALA